MLGFFLLDFICIRLEGRVIRGNDDFLYIINVILINNYEDYV